MIDERECSILTDSSLLLGVKHPGNAAHFPFPFLFPAYVDFWLVALVSYPSCQLLRIYAAFEKVANTERKIQKLYFLPNLDSAKFDFEKIEETIQKAGLAKRSFLSGTTDSRLTSNSSNPDTVKTDQKMTMPSNPTIGGSGQSGQKAHCCHCGGSDLNILNDGRYRCLGCKKRFVANKIVWK